MRVESLGFFRFVAAIVIVLYHYRYASAAQSIDFVHWPIFNGVQMVTFFFVLSGYVNYLAYGGKPGSKNAFSLPRFTASRIARVYPLYFFALIIALLLFSAVGQAPSLTVLLLHMTTLQAWIPEYAQTLNFVTWTISVDIFLYAIFPPVLLWMHRAKTTFSTMVVVNAVLYLLTQIILSSVLSQPDYPGEPSTLHNFTHNFPLFHLSSFCLGMLAGYIVTHFQQQIKPLAHNGFSLGFLLFLLLAIIYGEEVNHLLGWALETPSSYAPLFMLMLMVVSCSQAGWVRLLEHRFFVYLGSLSYAIYIFQILVWFLYKSLLQPALPQLNNTQHLWLGIAVLLVVAALSHRYIETPGNRWLRRKLVKWLVKEPVKQKDIRSEAGK